MSDLDLVARARQGDSAAFGELVDRHRVAVYRAALAALGSHADAEDAAQDAFLAAYRRLGSFRGEASFKTWLLTITWHQAINRRRAVVRVLRRLVQPKPEEESDSLIAQVASLGPTPEDAIVTRQAQQAIREEIRALKPAFRDALLLAQCGDHTYDEIGQMVGAPVGTIKWRVSQARRVLKTRLRARGLDVPND